MKEMIDIYNANLERIGEMERTQAHMEGQWHCSFHCWVITKECGGAVLFQLRSAQKNYPNMLDISAAGHLSAGEALEEGVREVIEELGINVTINDLYPLGYRISASEDPDGGQNREYQGVYLTQVEKPLDSYSPLVKEVAGLFWLNIKDGFKLFTEETDSSLIQGIEFDKSSNEWKNVKKVVTREDFLPRIQKYYLTILIMAERFLEGRFPLSIS